MGNWRFGRHFRLTLRIYVCKSIVTILPTFVQYSYPIKNSGQWQKQDDTTIKYPPKALLCPNQSEPDCRILLLTQKTIIL